MTTHERFWSHVAKDGDCWEWMGSRNEKGYGLVRHDGRMLRAHRYAWEEENGPIPDGIKVCHRCDNPPCVRPDHLFLGTQRENLLDAESKGRKFSPFRGQVQIGEANRYARMTDERVRETRRLSAAGVRQKDIAEQFGVVPETISHILRGKTWTHVD